MKPGWRMLAALLALLLAACATRPPAPRWTAAWASAQMALNAEQMLAPAQWRDATLRQIVRVAAGGPALRVRISNLYGSTPLVVAEAGVALAQGAGRPGLRPGSHRALTVQGRSHFAVPAGSELASDPVDLPVQPFDELAVSLRIAEMPALQTGHPGSRSTSFLQPGAAVAAVDWPAAQALVRWLLLAGVEVMAAAPGPVLVAIGDSITDGYGVLTDSQTRWTDLWARRRAAEGRAPVPVLNAGIGGNRLLRDGLGPALAARFERDALAQAGVTHVLVQIGINDLGALQRGGQADATTREALHDQLTLAWAALAARAREAGVCLLGATLMPFAGSDYYRPDAHTEALRQRLNRWIREAAPFDAVVDFDAALRDPARPERLLPALDSGDGLHPSAAGYAAMAAIVGDSALAPCPAARSGRR